MFQRICEEIQNWPGHRPFRMAIVGDVHAGKTTRAREWIQSLSELGLSCFGCLEVACFDSERNRLGYDFENIRTGERRAFARVQTIQDGNGLKKYHFDDSVWPWFEEVYRSQQDKDIAVFDEIGILEANGKGMMPFVRHFLSQSRDLRGCIAVCRKSEWDRICGLIGEWDWIDWIHSA